MPALVPVEFPKKRSYSHRKTEGVCPMGEKEKRQGANPFILRLMFYGGMGFIVLAMFLTQGLAEGMGGIGVALLAGAFVEALISGKPGGGDWDGSGGK